MPERARLAMRGIISLERKMRNDKDTLAIIAVRSLKDRCVTIVSFTQVLV